MNRRRRSADVHALEVLFALERLAPRILLLVSAHFGHLLSILPFELVLRLLGIASLIFSGEWGGCVSGLCLCLNHLGDLISSWNFDCGFNLEFQNRLLADKLISNQGTYVRSVSTENSRLFPELPVREPFRMFKEQKSKMIFCLCRRVESWTIIDTQIKLQFFQK